MRSVRANPVRALLRKPESIGEQLEDKAVHLSLDLDVYPPSVTQAYLYHDTGIFSKICPTRHIRPIHVNRAAGSIAEHSRLESVSVSEWFPLIKDDAPVHIRSFLETTLPHIVTR